MWNRRETILPQGIDGKLIVKAGKQTIIDSVLEYTGESFDDVIARDRRLTMVLARHYIHYFLTVIQELSLREIGEITGLDHASVLSSRRVVENWNQVDKLFRAKTYAIASLIISKTEPDEA